MEGTQDSSTPLLAIKSFWRAQPFSDHKHCSLCHFPTTFFSTVHLHKQQANQTHDPFAFHTNKQTTNVISTFRSNYLSTLHCLVPLQHSAPFPSFIIYVNFMSNYLCIYLCVIHVCSQSENQLAITLQHHLISGSVFSSC